MRSDGHQRSFTANVLMQFILQIDETVVRVLVEVDVTQNGRHRKRTNSTGVRLNEELLTLGSVGRINALETWWRSVVKCENLREKIQNEKPHCIYNP